ncbi:replication initiation protein [Methylobacterium sp. GC_Met_2]|uniref:replication initiation protein n=1 Tax=Methylobacterium sp. GC_Met_2 TaxID=2937376 RepID=UPI00226BB743|nr:replication initiation protein [Methylobacterium sp. GC_Met_2]
MDSNVLPLFPEDNLKLPAASGSVWKVDHQDPATVPVPLQIVINKVEGPYTEQDRKLWTFLLHAVFDEIGENTVHELNIIDINRVFREVGGKHDSAWIWESAKRLTRTVIEWEYTFEDDRFDGVSSLFGAQISKPMRAAGILRFSFPALLIPIIKQPSRFARLRVHFLIKLSGKYAVTLYEILEGYANRHDPSFTVSLKELRHWLKVPDNSYDDWKDFKKRVLDPAVDQINDDPLGAGFTVAYTPLRQGRFYDAVTFRVDKTNARRAIEGTIRRNIKTKANRGNPTARPILKPDTYARARKAGPGLDVHGAEADFWAFWESKGRPAFDKSADAAFIGWCRKKAAEL